MKKIEVDVLKGAEKKVMVSIGEENVILDKEGLDELFLLIGSIKTDFVMQDIENEKLEFKGESVYKTNYLGLTLRIAGFILKRSGFIAIDGTSTSDIYVYEKRPSINLTDKAYDTQGGFFGHIKSPTDYEKKLLEEGWEDSLRRISELNWKEV